MHTLAQLCKKLDAKIIDTVQDAYLWLLDRTGVYAATISAVILLFSIGGSVLDAKHVAAKWILIIIGAIGLVIEGLRYVAQDKGNYTFFNMMAMSSRENHFRPMLAVVLFNVLILNCIMGDLPWAIVNVGWIAFGYTQTVMIRDRDKKPFFEPKEEVAFDGAH